MSFFVDKKLIIIYENLKKRETLTMEFSVSLNEKKFITLKLYVKEDEVLDKFDFFFGL